MILQVIIGENLNYTVGRLHYSSAAGANPTASNTYEITTTTIIILSVIAVVMAFIIILLVIIIICVVIKKSKKQQNIAFTGNTDVSMYASPAYGTHQVFTGPGLDHLYEPIDDFCEEETTKLQDTTSPANDDDEIDAEGYLKMKPSCEVVDQTLTESSQLTDTCSTFVGSKSTDEYVQALGSNLSARSIKSDDGRDDGDEDNKSANKNNDNKDDGKDDVDDNHDKDDDVIGNKDDNKGGNKDGNKDVSCDGDQKNVNAKN